MENRLKNIKAFVFDVDGVLTDGRVLVGLDGEFYRSFDEKDLFALRMASMNSYTLAVITGGGSQCIPEGLCKCGIKREDFYMKSRNKVLDFDNFCERYSLSPSEIMYFGDDTPDAEVLKISGIGVCPSDATLDARQSADIISDYPGGRGFVRDMIEKTLRLQGKWIFSTDQYKSKF